MSLLFRSVFILHVRESPNALHGGRVIGVGFVHLVFEDLILVFLFIEENHPLHNFETMLERGRVEPLVLVVLLLFSGFALLLLGQFLLKCLNVGVPDIPARNLLFMKIC